jgi:hypothetical protein
MADGAKAAGTSAPTAVKGPVATAAAHPAPSASTTTAVAKKGGVAFTAGPALPPGAMAPGLTAYMFHVECMRAGISKASVAKVGVYDTYAEGGGLGKTVSGLFTCVCAVGGGVTANRGRPPPPARAAPSRFVFLGAGYVGGVAAGACQGL